MPSLCLQNVTRGGRGEGKLAREYLGAHSSFDAQRDWHVLAKIRGIQVWCWRRARLLQHWQFSAGQVVTRHECRTGCTCCCQLRHRRFGRGSASGPERHHVVFELQQSTPRIPQYSELALVTGVMTIVAAACAHPRRPGRQVQVLKNSIY